MSTALDHSSLKREFENGRLVYILRFKSCTHNIIICEQALTIKTAIKTYTKQLVRTEWRGVLSTFVSKSEQHKNAAMEKNMIQDTKLCRVTDLTWSKSIEHTA